MVVNYNYYLYLGYILDLLYHHLDHPDHPLDHYLPVPGLHYLHHCFRFSKFLKKISIIVCIPLLPLEEIYNLFPTKELDIIVTKLTTFDNYVLNYINTPNVILKDAIIASCSIPYVIGITTLENIQYIDGDLTSSKYMEKNNLPLSFTAYKIIDEKNKVLGFRKAKKIINFSDLINSCDIGLSTVIVVGAIVSYS